MSAAESSRRTLIQKLGIRKSDAIAFLNAPDGFLTLLGNLPDEVSIIQGAKRKLDFIQLFVRDRASLEREFPRSKTRLEQDGMIWVSWPKGSSKLRADLSDVVVREVGLKNGLVDVKVCSIDSSWSAMKFVRRLKDRRGSSIGV